MSTVYIVVKQTWGGTEVQEVFSTFEAAHTWIEKTQPNEEEKFNCFIHLREVK